MDPNRPMSQEQGNLLIKNKVESLEERVAAIEYKLRIGFREKLITLPKIGEQIATNIIKVFPDEKSLREAIKENRLLFKKAINDVLKDNFK